MSALIDLGNAIVAEIENASFSMTPELVSRAYVPEYDPEIDTDLKVYVLTSELVAQPSAKDSHWFDYTSYIAIYKKVADTSTATVDPLVSFVEEVIDRLRTNTNLTAMPTAKQFGEITNRPTYDPAVLDSKRTFVSAIGVNYRLLR